jgi:hypothetical protein
MRFGLIDSWLLIVASELSPLNCSKYTVLTILLMVWYALDSSRSSLGFRCLIARRNIPKRLLYKPLLLSAVVHWTNGRMAVCHCGLEDQRYWPSVLRLRTVERLHFHHPFHSILDNRKANRDKRTSSCYSPSNANIVESTLRKLPRLVTLPLLRGTIQILARLPINRKWWRWLMCSTNRIYLTFSNIKLNLSIFKPFIKLIIKLHLHLVLYWVKLI